MRNHIHLSFSLLCVFLLVTACGNKPDPDTEPDPDPDPGLTVCGNLTELSDDRDGQTYQVVKIGNQCWMAENLNFVTDKSYCFDDKDSSCDIYGRLYTWEAAQNACPTGWHLPTSGEWDVLVAELGGEDVAGGKMKTTGTADWREPNTDATNESGFNGIPSGSRGSGGSYGDLEKLGLYWTNTSAQINDAYAYYRSIAYTTAVIGEFAGDKRTSFAIRCVRD